VASARVPRKNEKTGRTKTRSRRGKVERGRKAERRKEGGIRGKEGGN
jgi:hypothetical protein